jgi:diguanylate cyclase (GGDEF)-like protein
MLIFYPLQCSRSVIGYLVMDRMSPVSEFNMLDIILTLLANNIDMVQEKSVMAGRNEVLQELYRHDSLTGLYNRFGMENTGAEYCRRLAMEGKKYYFYFIDMDGLKKINDKHGHDAGDWALRLMADSLRNVCGENGDFCMRYGGDEFLAIGTVSVGSMRKKLEKELKKQVKISGCTLDLSFSLGGFAAEKGTEENLRDAIKRADKEMYVVKQKKKKGKDKKDRK